MWFIKEETLGVQHPGTKYLGPFLTYEEGKKAIEWLIDHHKNNDGWDSPWGKWETKNYKKFYWTTQEIIDKNPENEKEEIAVYRVELIATTPIGYVHSETKHPVYIEKDGEETYNKDCRLQAETLDEVNAKIIPLYYEELKKTQPGYFVAEDESQTTNISTNN